MKKIPFTLFAVAILITSCVSDKQEGPLITDAFLFDLSQSTSSFVYFKNSFDTLTTNPNADHRSFVRIRFNPKAKDAMNDSLSGLASASFPDESMIVKEVYDSKGGQLIETAIMYKLHNAANNASGWVWCKLHPDGSTLYSASDKGGLCVSCHSLNNNADLVRTFALH